MKNALIKFGIIMILLIIINFSGCFENSSKEKGYLGLEYIHEAYDMANNDTNNLIINGIGCYGHISKGKFEKVGYGFYNIINMEDSNSTKYTSTRIEYGYEESPRIKENPMQHEFVSIDFSNGKNNYYFDIEYIIDNIIDTDLAYDKIIGNADASNNIDDIKKYNSELSEAHLERWVNDFYCWIFTWTYDQKPSDPGDDSLEIIVDAKTGEILEINEYH